jgi:Spy/CpxP family protein refolding chaperone
MRINMNRFAKGVTATVGFFFLCAAPGLNFAQSTPPGPVLTPQKISPATRPKEGASQTDDFFGLKLTVEQKAKVDEIHQNMKSRLDVVAKDDKLSADHKAAMLEGYRRIENSQVFKVLTPEQQIQVRKRALARRAAEQQRQQQVFPK